MSDSDRRRSPLQPLLIVLMLAAGGWYFFRHADMHDLGLQDLGLPGLARQPGDNESSSGASSDDLPRGALASYRSEQAILSPSDRRPRTAAGSAPARSGSAIGGVSPVAGRLEPSEKIPHLRVASWALDGFGPTKLARERTRRRLAAVMRQFDVIALQQVASVERDLVARLADALNEGQTRYDYVLGEPTGPVQRPEQLAFLFDTTRVRVDRSQTYTLADPDDRITFDPLVVWFQAAGPPEAEAWTFSAVNLRVDLARAPSEVGLLADVLDSVRHDGRGEDDVVLLGLFQADDRYLQPMVGGGPMRAAVRSTPTDIYGRHQTSNVLVDTGQTREFVGRSGAFDFLRVYNLSVGEAESVTRHLPVFAEFTAHEGGQL